MIPTPTPTVVPSQVGSMSVSVHMFMTVGSSIAPTTEEKNKIKVTIGSSIGVTTRQLHSYGVATTTSRRRRATATSPSSSSYQRQQRKLLASSVWEVSFVVMVPPNEVPFEDAYDYAKFIDAELVSNTFEQNLTTSLGFSVVVDSVVSTALTPSEPTPIPTYTPTPIPSSYPTPIPKKKGKGKSKSELGSASSGVLIIVAAASLGMIFMVCGGGLFYVRKRKGNYYNSHKSDEMHNVEMNPYYGKTESFNFATASETAAAMRPTKERTSGLGQMSSSSYEGGSSSFSSSISSSSHTEYPAWVIPKSNLKLESEPFARGGGGQIFKGKYMGHAIAAKQLFSLKSSTKQKEEFEGEVAMLSKLTHPCVLAFFGIAEDTSGVCLPPPPCVMHVVVF
jgi:hypothetical protein